MSLRALAVLAVVFVLAACRSLPPGAACWSLDGRPLAPVPMEPAARAAAEQHLAAAQAVLASAPDDRDAAVWVARRLGYLGRFREAIDVLTAALGVHRDDPHLLRHRGHRWITLRDFAAAERDLARAAQRCRVVPDVVEPDGMPTPGRAPHSTLHFNVHYHLGLARWLRGDFGGAERAWLDCLAVAGNDEARVAVAHWLWCTRVRQANPAGAMAVAAAISPGMDVVENQSYHRLCLFYAGRVSAAEVMPLAGSAGAALAFGLAHHALATGDRERGVRDLQALRASPGWTAFGVIAAEAELARQGR